MKLIALLAGITVTGALVAGAAWKGYRMGAAHIQAQWDTQIAELAAAHEREVARLEKINRQVVVKYIPKVEYVRGKTLTLTKEVPIYVTPEADRRCALPAGFERLHDAALREDNLSAGHTAGGADDAAGAVEAAALVLSDVGRAVIGNYGACRETAERLTALQAWAHAVSRYAP